MRRLALTTALLATLAACHRDAPKPVRRPTGPVTPMAHPRVRQIGEGKTWRLLAPVAWRAATGDSVVVPAGYVAELGAVPRWFHPYLTPDDPQAGPAVVHDYLYWTRRCTRDEADGLFRLALTEQGVADTLVRQLADGASSWGGAAWRAYAADRAAELPRWVPPAARPDGALESWPQYQRYLRDTLRAAEPPVVASPGLCGAGR